MPQNNTPSYTHVSSYVSDMKSPPLGTNSKQLDDGLFSKKWVASKQVWI